MWTKDWWIVVFCGVCCTLSERPAISRDYHDVTSNNHNVNANHSCTVCFHQAFDCFFVYYFVKVILCSTTFAGFFFFFMSMILNFWFISTYNNYMRFRSNSDQNEALTLPSPSRMFKICLTWGLADEKPTCNCKKTTLLSHMVKPTREKKKTSSVLFIHDQKVIMLHKKKLFLYI